MAIAINPRLKTRFVIAPYLYHRSTRQERATVFQHPRLVDFRRSIGPVRLPFPRMKGMSICWSPHARPDSWAAPQGTLSGPDAQGTGPFARYPAERKRPGWQTAVSIVD